MPRLSKWNTLTLKSAGPREDLWGGDKTILEPLRTPSKLPEAKGTKQGHLILLLSVLDSQLGLESDVVLGKQP